MTGMMRNLLSALAFLVCWAAVGPALGEIPEPSVAPASSELTFRYRDPERVSVLLPGETTPTLYWYMLYTVENATGSEVDFLPRFTLVTDTLQVVPAEVQVSPEAFKAIQRRTGDPLLVPPEKAVGRLLCGKDQAKRSVAIWRDFDPRAKSFKVFVAGLSSEMTRLRNPTFDPAEPESDENPRHYVLRRTLEIPYRLPVGESMRHQAVPERRPEQQKWIMR